METGKKKTSKGYVQVLVHGHPRADSNGYVFEHIYVFEKETGISVPQGCCIHHLNGIKDDNRIENLCLMTHKAHTVMHHNGTKLKEKTKQLISEKAKERFSDKTKHPSYKEVDIDKIQALIDEGWTVEKACNAFGITKRTYYNKRRTNNAE